MAPRASAMIRDVAKLAGVSPTTVSHALNGKGRIAEETLEKVRAAAAALNYVPSLSAVHLRSQRNPIIGIQFGHTGEDGLLPRSSFHHAVLNGAAIAAAAEGWPVVMLPSKMSETALAQLGFDLVIALDLTDESPLLHRTLERGGIIVSNFAHGIFDARPSSARIGILAWQDPAAMSIEHLAAQGYRRVFLVVSPMLLPYERELIDAASRSATDVGIALEVFKTSDSEKPARFAELIRRAGPTDALWLPEDTDVFLAFSIARDHGVTIPEQLGLMTGLDVPSNAYVVPSVSAIEMTPEIYGRRAVELLLRLQTSETESWIEADPVPVRVAARRSTDRLGRLTDRVGGPS